ncbi:MAG: response regulator [Candidatus Woesebacteria bacterium]
MSQLIYIVDDDASLLEVLQLALEEHDYIPIGFAGAKAFWKKISKHKPDAVVLDIGLDGEQGDQIAKKLKSSSEYKDLPVILISADQSLSQKAKASKADSYLAKPFSLDSLVYVIDSFISSRKE